MPDDVPPAAVELRLVVRGGCPGRGAEAMRLGKCCGPQSVKGHTSRPDPTHRVGVTCFSAWAHSRTRSLRSTTLSPRSRAHLTPGGESDSR